MLFCLIVWHNKALHKRSLVLITNLSVAGILNAATVPVFEFIYVYYYPSWPLGRLGTNLQNSIWLFSLVLPFVTVTAITIERYLATVHYVFYQTNAKASNFGVVVFLLWVYSLAWTVVISTRFAPAPDTYYLWNVPQNLYYIFLGLHLVVPLLIITVLYQRILSYSQESGKAVSQVGKRHNGGGGGILKSVETSPVEVSREVRLAKTIAMVIGTLYAVWVPVVIMEVVYNFDFYDCAVEQGGTVCVFVTSLNGCLYPLIYFYRIKEVKKDLLTLWRKLKNMVLCHCCCQCELLICCHSKEDGASSDHPYSRVDDDYDEGGPGCNGRATPLFSTEAEPLETDDYGITYDHPYSMVDDDKDEEGQGCNGRATPLLSKAEVRPPNGIVLEIDDDLC